MFSSAMRCSAVFIVLCCLLIQILGSKTNSTCVELAKSKPKEQTTEILNDNGKKNTPIKSRAQNPNSKKSSKNNLNDPNQNRILMPRCSDKLAPEFQSTNTIVNNMETAPDRNYFSSSGNTFETSQYSPSYTQNFENIQNFPNVQASFPNSMPIKYNLFNPPQILPQSPYVQNWYQRDQTPYFIAGCPGPDYYPTLPWRPFDGSPLVNNYVILYPPIILPAYVTNTVPPGPPAVIVSNQTIIKCDTCTQETKTVICKDAELKKNVCDIVIKKEPCCVCNEKCPQTNCDKNNDPAKLNRSEIIKLDKITAGITCKCNKPQPCSPCSDAEQLCLLGCQKVPDNSEDLDDDFLKVYSPVWVTSDKTYRVLEGPPFQCCEC